LALRSTTIFPLNSKRSKTNAGGLVAIGILILGFAASPLRAEAVNDFPTSARADYVFGCMKANGETRDSLDRCSCSIDVIASLITYDQYVSAETFMSMGQVPGEQGAVFRGSEQAKTAITNLQRAQAEGEIRCF
jgi:hypothetical protein